MIGQLVHLGGGRVDKLALRIGDAAGAEADALGGRIQNEVIGYLASGQVDDFDPAVIAGRDIERLFVLRQPQVAGQPGAELDGIDDLAFGFIEGDHGVVIRAHVQRGSGRRGGEGGQKKERAIESSHIFSTGTRGLDCASPWWPRRTYSTSRDNYSGGREPGQARNTSYSNRKCPAPQAGKGLPSRLPNPLPNQARTRASSPWGCAGVPAPDPEGRPHPLRHR